MNPRSRERLNVSHPSAEMEIAKGGKHEYELFCNVALDADEEFKNQRAHWWNMSGILYSISP